MDNYVITEGGSICPDCLASTSGRCPRHGLTFYPGSGPVVKTTPAKAPRCPTCGGRVVIVEDDEGTHYFAVQDEGAEALLRTILEDVAGDCADLVGRVETGHET